MPAGLAGAFGFSAFDVIMPCSSLYHATAWGLPFTAAVNGCKLVLPCDKMDGASLQELIKSEGVTFSGGVPTIWTMYLAHLERTGEDAGTLKQLIIGGSAVPRAMAETFQRRYGVTVRQIWGMTETSPLGVIATPTPELAAEGEDVRRRGDLDPPGPAAVRDRTQDRRRRRRELPWDGESSGALQVRGPWVVAALLPRDMPAADADGWFDTGDIATIDRFGFIRITDRNEGRDQVGRRVDQLDRPRECRRAPAPACRSPRSSASPTRNGRSARSCFSKPHEGETVTRGRRCATILTPQVVSWWMPDAILFAPVPLTATGKIDKKALRDRYRDLLVTTNACGASGSPGI